MNWDDYFMNLAENIALKSKDTSTKVGCVIIGPENEIRSTGYNGFPRGCKDDIPKRYERPTKYTYTVHSEANAIYHAARIGTSLKDCKIYITMFPCSNCALGIIQSGIKEVISYPPDNERWWESFKISLELFNEVGIKVRFIEKTT